MGSSVYGDLLSGQAIYMIVHQDDSPSENFLLDFLGLPPSTGVARVIMHTRQHAKAFGAGNMYSSSLAGY